MFSRAHYGHAMQEASGITSVLSEGWLGQEPGLLPRKWVDSHGRGVQSSWGLRLESRSMGNGTSLSVSTSG